MQITPNEKATGPFVQGTFQPNHFQHGLCSCFDSCGTCCLGFWCPCILFGHSRARLQNPQLSKEELKCCTGACCGYATVCLLFPGFQCIFGCLQRGDVRGRYGIDGGGCTDCLTHWCCDCCALIQEDLEVQEREDAAMRGMGGQRYH